MRSLGIATLGLISLACATPVAPRLAVHPAKGEVSYQGKPCGGALVLLHPLGAYDADTPRPRALVRSDGAFDLSTYADGDGAPAGDYVVTVEWRKVDDHPEQGKNVLPERYADPRTSGLKVSVSAETGTLPPIRLSR